MSFRTIHRGLRDFRGALIGLTLIGWAIAAFAADAPSNGDKPVTSGAVAAGSPDADGWYSARSTEGGFSARFPAPFTTGSNAGKTDGVQLRSHMISSKSRAGIQYTLICLERADGHSEEMVEQTLAGVRQSFPSVKVTAFSQNGLRGQAFEAHDSNGPGTSFSGRVFSVSGQACQFTALYLGAARKELSAEIQKALESFRPRPSAN
jgi:hypothetical protein